MINLFKIIQTEKNHKNVNLYQFSGKKNRNTTLEENLKLIQNLRGKYFKEFNMKIMNNERSCEYPGDKTLNEIQKNNHDQYNYKIMTFNQDVKLGNH